MTEPLASIPALVLVGGQGTRLRPAVSDRPKPMAEAQGRPFLEWLLLYLKAQGLTRLVFASGHLSEWIDAHFGDGSAWGLSIEHSVEESPLGTGGAIRLAAPLLSAGRFFLINGDTLFAANLSELLEAHEAQGAALTLALHHVNDNSRYGRVRLSGQRLIGFEEKPATPTPSWINGGTFLLERNILERFPQTARFSFEQDVLPGLIRDTTCIGVKQRAYFVDIGLPETYHAFAQDIPTLLEQGLFGVR